MRRAVVCALALLLAACAGVRGPESPGDVPPVPDVPASDPVGLVGLWRVSGAEGAGERTWLRLAHGSYELWPQDECRGFAAGGWRASARVFVASAPFAANGDCSLDPWPDGDGWLTSARAYRPTGDGWELLDADGAVVARLAVDGAPEPIDTAVPEYAQPPEVTDDLRAAFAEPAPLPEGMRPAEAADLVGRWVRPGWGTRSAYVELAADGTYEGSDGCNASGGAWGVDEDGRLLATSGISTAIGCDGAPVPTWLATAARAGFDGRTLVLLDADGEEIARLVRA
jgi:hypothetical protein